MYRLLASFLSLAFAMILSQMSESHALDGTPVLVKDINPFPKTATPLGATRSLGIVFYVADDGEHGSELWRTDGTAAGTLMVRDILAGTGSSQISDLTAAGVGATNRKIN